MRGAYKERRGREGKGLGIDRGGIDRERYIWSVETEREGGVEREGEGGGKETEEEEGGVEIVCKASSQVIIHLA